jgi:hypothetical protein
MLLIAVPLDAAAAGDFAVLATTSAARVVRAHATQSLAATLTIHARTEGVAPGLEFAV